MMRIEFAPSNNGGGACVIEATPEKNAPTHSFAGCGVNARPSHLSSVANAYIFCGHKNETKYFAVAGVDGRNLPSRPFFLGPSSGSDWEGELTYMKRVVGGPDAGKLYLFPFGENVESGCYVTSGSLASDFRLECYVYCEPGKVEALGGTDAMPAPLVDVPDTECRSRRQLWLPDVTFSFVALKNGATQQRLAVDDSHGPSSTSATLVFAIVVGVLLLLLLGCVAACVTIVLVRRRREATRSLEAQSARGESQRGHRHSRCGSRGVSRSHVSRRGDQ
jgi:hypothetical protein